MDNEQTATDEAQIARMREILRRQRETFTAELPVGASIRKQRLQRAIDLVVSNRDRFAQALSADFGHRSATQSMITDIMSTVKSLKHALKSVDRWMRPEKRKLDFPLALLGARAQVEYQPKGVVGVISPWNFPVFLTFGPLAQIFAAGNRAMVKPSEHTPRTSETMRDLAAQYFPEHELAFVLGGPAVGKAFAGLAFDHLIFTGGTGIARHVLHAAADNLVPTTLELGGKSPVIVGESADLARTSERVAMGKMLNAGQICLAPDYMLVPKAKEASLVAALQQAVARLYPTLLANEDYTSVVDSRHRERLQGLIDDAKARGAEVIAVNPGNEDFAAASGNKMPLHIIRNTTPEMRVMREEIFGPILPIMTYNRTEEAIAHVNAGERPLALYYFGEDPDEERRVVERTVSGGVTLNDVIFHAMPEDLPFGGIGPSGMGSYHGFDGFKTFSHTKAVYRQPKLDLAGLAGLKPPYGEKTRKALKREIEG
ncbi:coniferyl aldehyde dehydrogenase [Nannocystis radixulma]|uniref:Aldehyde dehydrogenase n=1 Tax=Nannocystis radixulma TaxID=2995305 RepID=A0ABT5B2N4_9BACT|nr:coniferyl aldehyde dehydrogenase [Nannocystis radixulma]MDC0668360.1 coniferyl aldehyde dehydrogenase [Nannocystis radixulma]